MSVLMVFHCKLEKPIRRCDLKVIEKSVVLPDHASTVSNRFITKFGIVARSVPSGNVCVL